MKTIINNLFNSKFNSKKTIINGFYQETSPFIVSQIIKNLDDKSTVLWVRSQDELIEPAAEEMRSFIGDEVIQFPAWDCLPYDINSPANDILTTRLNALGEMLEPRKTTCVISSVKAIMQRLIPKQSFKKIKIKKTQTINLNDLTNSCLALGMKRRQLVQEVGEFSVRGDIFDIFSPASNAPFRLNFFDNEIENIKQFDPISQRSLNTEFHELTLIPCNEVILSEETIKTFRTKYRNHFKTSGNDDELYNAVSQGNSVRAMEHWLALFYEQTDTIFDYLNNNLYIITDFDFEPSVQEHFDNINEYYKARNSEHHLKNKYNNVYYPTAPSTMYLSPDDVKSILNYHKNIALFPATESLACVDKTERLELSNKLRKIYEFSEIRNNPKLDFWSEVTKKIRNLSNDKSIILTYQKTFGLAKLSEIFKEYNLSFTKVESLDQINETGIYAWQSPLNEGFKTDKIWIITEKDLTGIDIKRDQAKRKTLKAENFISDTSSIVEGDLVVHSEHGIGKYAGLDAVTVGEIIHDCLIIVYEGGDKLFLPVENIELLTRYGNDDSVAKLDKLGTASWQTRKARVKNRITELAFKLVETAALRQKEVVESIKIIDKTYQDFCDGFEYELTPDQEKVEADIIQDLSTGKIMERLICGDVGFGKTELALRAAFLVAYTGKQVAVVTPTTILSRQHYKNFTSRFNSLPIRLTELSRFTPVSGRNKIKQAIENHSVDIIIGTHSILANTINFKNLGLIIIDEEQHFGVKQKENLKSRFPKTHVLTMTATPIPRTLQLAVSGVRDLSIIATPPVNRVAVRTFISPVDHVVIQEALKREAHRGGQSFYVCPRIEDIDGIKTLVNALVPELSTIVIHGQMPSNIIEKSISDFIEKKYDILISTNIIDSGIDIPNANTMIVHRADMFGLAQLYQLRGRIGRGKSRAYAYLTTNSDKKLSHRAKKRLEVLQTLDSLGAGFSLASYDLDIRGAGNLLGEQQSGHIKEVGVALYQQMLTDAVEKAFKQADQPDKTPTVEQNSDDVPAPILNIGLSILIPKYYIDNDAIRLDMYKRISQVKTPAEILDLKAELNDRFGNLPHEVDNLFKVISIKNICLECNISRIDVGSKSTLIGFHNDYFENPLGLIKLMQNSKGQIKIRNDQKLIINIPQIPALKLTETLKEILKIKNQIS